MIVLSFDDCYIVEWTEMVLLGRGRKWGLTFYVSDLRGISSGRWGLLKDIEAAGHEIGFHGLRHAKAGQPDLEIWMRNEIEAGMEEMAEHGFSPAHFSYPYGYRTQETDELLLGRFQTLRGVNAGGVYRRGAIPRVWSAIEFDFDRRDKDVICKRGPEDVVCVFMHKSDRARLRLLMECADVNGEEFVTVSEAFK